MQLDSAAQQWADVHHVLLAGDASDLPALSAILEALPEDAYGTVFIEVAAPIQVQQLTAPRRVAVTWLVREGRMSDLPATIGAARGELLTRAVSGWVEEWMPEDGDDEWSLWIGCAASARVEELCARLQRQLGIPGGSSIRH